MRRSNFTSGSEVVELKVLYEESYKELLELLRWFSHLGPVPILIGGWAVYAYNSYCGSVDIDIVGESSGGKFLDAVERYELTHGYEFVSRDPLGLEKVSRKPIRRGGKVIGHTDIDACTIEDRRPARFREDGTKELPYSLCLENRYRREIELSGNLCYIPCKPLLLMYKLKAARDRAYDLRKGEATMAPEKVEFLRAKLLKDRSDLLALLDPDPKNFVLEDEMNAATVNELVERFNLEFALESLRELPKMEGAMNFYDLNLSRRRVEGWISRVLR